MENDVAFDGELICALQCTDLDGNKLLLHRDLAESS